MNLPSRKLLTLTTLILAPAACTETPDQQQTPDSQESQAAGQSFPTLNSALAAGDVVLGSVHGNGSSSGTALDATLQNTTGATLRLSTRLVPALYLLSGTESAQNMLATRVYESGGRFRMVDGESVIDLPPGETIPIAFNAYCVDFEKDNPSAEDSFTLAEMPSWLAPLASGIVSYEESLDYDATAMRRAQVALWLAQGEDPQAVRNTFRVSDADMEAAASLGIVSR